MINCDIPNFAQDTLKSWCNVYWCFDKQKEWHIDPGIQILSLSWHEQLASCVALIGQVSLILCLFCLIYLFLSSSLIRQIKSGRKFDITLCFFKYFVREIFAKVLIMMTSFKWCNS